MGQLSGATKPIRLKLVLLTISAVGGVKPMHRWGPPWAFVAGGRKRGWLRPLVLTLLAKRPMNGTELIEEIYRFTGSLWRPSPGSVYPMLSELVEEGLIARRTDGKYELTEEGMELAKTLYAPLASAVDPLSELRGALSGLEEMANSSPGELRGRLQELKDLRRRLDEIIERLEGQGR